MEETIVRKLEQRGLTILEKIRETFPTIEDNETFERANKAAIYLKNMMAERDSYFDPIIDKTNKLHKESLAQKKRAKEPLFEAELYLKPMIARYLRVLEKMKREAEAKIAFGEETPETKEIIERPQPEMLGTSVVPLYKCRIVDEKLVPYPEYWIIDEKKLGKLARESKGQAKVPGVEFYTEDSTRTRKQ